NLTAWILLAQLLWCGALNAHDDEHDAIGNCGGRVSDARRHFSRGIMLVFVIVSIQGSAPEELSQQNPSC
ncbi:MAG: hypothetical protein AAF802_31440, partial [Planctomycetota bacterium]